MFKVRKPFAAGMVAAMAISYVVAEDSGIKLEPLHAFSSWEAGEVESFVPDPQAAIVPGKDKQLIDHVGVWLLQSARLSDNAQLFVGVGGAYFFILPSLGNQYSFGQRSAFGLTDAHGEFDFWKKSDEDHGLRLKVGVFPFKYNPDAKNLGEYMFRTYTYPTVIFTGGLNLINSTATQLNGFDANTKVGGFQNDLLVTVKTDEVPSGALSLTEMASYNVKDIFTIGAGFMFDNFFDPTGIADGKTKGGGGVGGGAYFVMKDGSIAFPNNAPSADLIADTAYYSFVGQKVMARASLDFGKMLPENNWLSSQDLRLYAETILMGVKDYPGFYDKLSHRIATMVGFNFPTFKVLDLLSVEYEYCTNPWVNSAAVAARGLVPIPEVSVGSNVKGDDLKWTVYARKNIFKSFSIYGQVARDHLRLIDYFGHTNDQDVMQTHEDWYWAFQLGYAI